MLTKMKPSVGRSGNGRATSHDVRASTLPLKCVPARNKHWRWKEPKGATGDGGWSASGGGCGGGVRVGVGVGWEGTPRTGSHVLGLSQVRLDVPTLRPEPQRQLAPVVRGASIHAHALVSAFQHAGQRERVGRRPERKGDWHRTTHGVGRWTRVVHS